VQELNAEGCVFLGHGGAEDLEELERTLVQGAGAAAVFTEFPSNPLLKVQST
jgi:cystathionine gamma-synthase